MKKFKHTLRTNGDTAGFGGNDGEFAVLTSQKVSNQYSIFIDNSLDTPQDMRYAIQVLATAQESDEVLMFLNSPGGSVDAAQALINVMMQCEAPITVIGSGTIASAAAIILSACESFQLDPFCSVMYHPCTGGYGGTMDDIVGYGTFQKKQTEDLLNYYAIGILTEEELRQIHVEKATIWLSTKDFTERFKRKMQAQERLSDYIEEAGINPQEITPSVYISLMNVVLKDMEEEAKAQAAKPVKKPRAKKAVVES